MNPRHRTASGFSLIELMVAMSIFSVIGISIVTLLGRSTEFSRAGTSTTEVLDSLQSFTESFTADASTMYSRAGSDDGAPAVRLWSDVVRSDVTGDQKPDATIRRLMFVRMIPDEATAPLTRTAGATVGARESIDQSKDQEQAEKGQLRATCGVSEVFWTAVPEDKDDLAMMTLYRGVVSPIGHPETTLFPSKVAGDPTAKGPQDRGPVDLAEIRARARPVLSGVLYFGVEFWSRRTETWDLSIAPPKGPLEMWDSTRGIMRKGKGLDGFWFAKPEGSLDRPTLQDPTDDTFPRRLRVTLVAEEAGQAARSGIVMGDLAADATFIELSDTKFIPGTDTTRRFVKIGDEWIEFANVDGARITGCKRGVRGTPATSHPHGSRVHYGRTVVRDIGIATFRDAYRDELPAIGGRR
jgi:prepilin-type N-terminal cleavage/methylation domain-containing protein